MTFRAKKICYNNELDILYSVFLMNQSALHRTHYSFTSQLQTGGVATADFRAD